MSQQKLLKSVLSVLNQAGIQYMLTGSIVSSLQGEPRSTNDIDVVIAIDKLKVRELARGFSSPDFYLDEDSIRGAIESQSMFNLIDLREGGKVDFWLLTNETFDKSRFSRKCKEEFMGLEMEVSSPEDTILAKLRWSKLSGGSEKQFIDAMRVYEVQYRKLDLDYLENWAKELGVESLLKRLRDEAETA